MFTNFKGRAYLDFDGVFNVDKSPFGDDVRTSYAVKVGRGLTENFSIVYSPTAMTSVMDLLAKHNVEVVFVSSWCDNLHILRVMDKLGYFPNARVLHGVTNASGKTRRDRNNWKYDAILADLKGDAVPFVWVDDEAVPVFKKAMRATLPDADKLLLAPLSWHGVTHGMLSDMDAFFSKF